MDNQLKITLYRIAQEQFSNIIKYSQAQLVHIAIITTDSSTKMIIIDDGIGIDNSKKSSGIGLRNILARLSVIHGTAVIRTAPAEGFMLEIKVPSNKY